MGQEVDGGHGRYSWPFGCFFLVVRPPLFGLGRGPITPPGTAMFLMDRKDLNSKTNKQTILGESTGKNSECLATFSGWFDHLYFGLGRGPISPPCLEMVFIDRKDLN